MSPHSPALTPLGATQPHNNGVVGISKDLTHHVQPQPTQPSLAQHPLEETKR